MGVATASLAMKFGELGQQTITAYEWDSETGGVTNITGEKTVTVVGSCVGSECNGGITPPPNSNDPITITTPSEESEISGTNVIIAGVASLSGEVRVFVDNIALKTITVDQNGSFTGTITVSKAGSHVLVVKTLSIPQRPLNQFHSAYGIFLQNFSIFPFPQARMSLPEHPFRSLFPQKQTSKKQVFRLRGRMFPLLRFPFWSRA